MTLRYGAVLEALWALRGRSEQIAPTESAVRYRAHTARGIAPLADLYVPPHATGASVVLVHGGGFVIGSRRMKPVRYLAARLSAANIAVCAIDYRMIFRGGRLDAAVDDVCDALELWRSRAPDPAAITLVGLSAGATLAMLAAARAGVAVHRLACCFGLYETDHLEAGFASLLPRLLFETADRASWRERSPRGVTQPAVPTLLLHGSGDGLVPVEQARRLAVHRESLGLPTRLVIYPDAPHNFFNFAGSAAAEGGVRELVEHVAIDQRARTGSHA